MEINIVVALILAIYAGIAQLDAISVHWGFYSPLFAGTITGLVLGDLNTGLAVGGSLQLMTLGVATYGGASVPDYLSGAILGTAIAIKSGIDPLSAIGIATPIALILTQLDIFGRMTNVVFQHMADRAAEKGDVKGVERANVLGILPWSLTRFIPVFFGLLFIGSLAEGISSFPKPLMDGLKYAGGILPAMGIAILMRQLPLKKFYPFYIVGFVLMAFFASAGLSILGVSLLGFALAAIYMMLKPNQASAAAAGADDMEVEIDE